MQNKIVVLILFNLLFLIGCDKNLQSFEKEIEKHRNSSLTLVPTPQKSLPYYTWKSLTPTWDKGDTVSLENILLFDQNNKEVSQQSFDGKVSIVSFIFTSCVGFCPTLIKKMKQMENKINNSQEVQYIAITVDPDVDTPKVLNAYAKTMNRGANPNWKFLTGPKDKILNLIRNTFASEVKKLKSGDLK